MGANVSRRSVHVKPRIRGSFVALAMERHEDEGRAGAQGRARMSVGDLSTSSLKFADVSWRWSATGMKGERERRGNALGSVESQN